MYAIGRNQHQTDNSWPNVVAFAFKKDNVAKLDGVKPRGVLRFGRNAIICANKPK